MKNYTEIINKYNVYVYPRKTNLVKDSQLIHNENIHIIEAPCLDISSSEIRNIINTKENLSKFISNDIYNYIIHNKLYIT